MIVVKINNFELFVKTDISVLEACKYSGIHIPRFCYHEKLSVAGNCRMCLVEIEKVPKPVASCAMPVINNMSIYTDSPLVKKSRENVLETLLLNHPLDCPICDQGGECDLQDQTKAFGGDLTRFYINKRSVEDKYCGPLIKTIMTRCIHCTRCVRFFTDVVGLDLLGTLNRGNVTEIGTYTSKLFESEVSGNVIDLCPVGALTSKPYAFKARPWELRSVESIDLLDGLGSNLYLNLKEGLVIRVIPKINFFLNENWISDKARFFYDSLVNQRIKKIVIKNSTEDSFNVLNFKDFKKSIGSIFSNTFLLKVNNVFSFCENSEMKSFSCSLIVNEDTDLKTILNIKYFVNQSNYLKASFRSIDSFNLFENSYVANNLNKVNDLNNNSNICFLISSNPKMECTLLNVKLRAKYINQNFKIIGLGLKVINNLPINFINLKLFDILKFFEGKHDNLSKILANSTTAPIFFFGESFNKRSLFDNFKIVQLIRFVFPSSIILNIALKSNTLGVKYSNVRPLNSKIIENTKLFLCFNLYDTNLARKVLNSKNSKLFWFNTHGSNLALKASLIVPTPSFYEIESIFINLEERVQQTSNLSTVLNNSVALSCQNLIFSKNGKLKNYTTIESILEIIQNQKLFNELNLKFSRSLNLNYLSICNRYSKYPLKSSLINFCSLANNYTKNSIILKDDS
jgi:NADH-quinone oxidoreductase chain G